jgi:hypothetical protein
MTREAVLASPDPIMAKRVRPIAADVSVEPVSPREACPARREANEGIVQHKTR